MRRDLLWVPMLLVTFGYVVGVPLICKPSKEMKPFARVGENLARLVLGLFTLILLGLLFRSIMMIRAGAFGLAGCGVISPFILAWKIVDLLNSDIYRTKIVDCLGVAIVLLFMLSLWLMEMHIEWP